MGTAAMPMASRMDREMREPFTPGGNRKSGAKEYLRAFLLARGPSWPSTYLKPAGSILCACTGAMGE